MALLKKKPEVSAQVSAEETAPVQMGTAAASAGMLRALEGFDNHLDVPFDYVFEYWDDVSRGGENVEMVRALTLWDRYYLLLQVLGRRDMVHPWIFARCREVEAAPDGYLDLWAREHYKDLADNTPMLTANRGWTTHGDLRVGDKVFAPNGAPVEVLAVSPQYTDSEMYEVEFVDGAKLLAGAGHQWRTLRKVRRRVAGSELRSVEHVEEITTTPHLKRCNVGAMTAALQYPVQPLAVDPYLLGVWLGDGGTGVNKLHCRDEEIFEEIERRGYKVRRAKSVEGLTEGLRALGLINGVKRIPEQYLHTHATQRMALLRGLMDTDGHCNTRGTATFVNINSTLARQVYDLAVGLGLRPRLRRYSYKSDVRAAVRGVYTFYQVSMQNHKDRNLFLLPYKAARAIDPGSHRECRNAVRVTRVASVPSHCIQVEGGMYLASRELIPTHNSTIITYAGIIQECLRDPNITVGIFSHTRALAQKFLSQIMVEFETNKKMQALFPDVIWSNPRRDSTQWSIQGGIVLRRTSNPKEATIEANGLVEGSPIGAHYRLRVYDDVVTPESVSTPEQIQKTTAAWENSDNLGTEGGRAWHAGTRYHFSDTYQAIMEKEVLRLRFHPATEDGTETGKPVLWSAQEWERRKRTQGPAVTACQNLLNPVAGRQGFFDEADLQVYEVRPMTINVYILVDPARSKKKDSAKTAMCVWGLDHNMNKFLIDGCNHRMRLDERWTNMAALYKKWKIAPGVQRIYVGYEKYGAQADLDYFLEQMRVPGNPTFPIVELAWPSDGPGGKDDRVQRLGPDLREHKVYLPMDTDKDKLTSLQRRVINEGYPFRVAKAIRKKDEDGDVYDLSEDFKTQVRFYPFIGMKDLIDAASRIYDMDPQPPMSNEEEYLEPEIV
jgi:hypothetical protein